MTTVVWPAPQVPGTGGCPSCDWVRTNPVPTYLLGNLIQGNTSYTCTATGCVPAPGGSCGTSTACIVPCGSGVSSTEHHRLALKLVGGTYDSTKKYSNGLSGCTDVLSSLSWFGDNVFRLDVWEDYRAGVWTGMMQIEVYDEYHNVTSSPCVGAAVPTCATCTGGSGFCAACSTTGGPSTTSSLFLAQGGPSVSKPSTAVFGSPGHCPWGGSLSYTITVYDDGTISIV